MPESEPVMMTRRGTTLCCGSVAAGVAVMVGGAQRVSRWTLLVLQRGQYLAS
jgi:hypothetical protein